MLERGVRVLLIVFTQILSGGSLCEKSCVDDLMKILLCEGGDVEQWLEPDIRFNQLGVRSWLANLAFAFAHI